MLILSRICYKRRNQSIQQFLVIFCGRLPEKNKAGVIENENVHKVVEECENLAQYLSDEEVEDFGRNDILAQVLKVPEYLGLVRGVGYGVSKRDYFPPQKRAKQEDVDGLKAMMGDVCKRLKALEDDKDMTRRQTPDSSIPSANDSCTPAPNNLPKGDFPCQLYLSSPHYRVVGRGKVFNNSGDKLHNQKLRNGHVRVLVEVAIDPKAQLPVPDDYADLNVVKDAIGTFVAWPINLIEISVAESQKIPPKSKQRFNKESVEVASKNRGTTSSTCSASKLSPHCSSLQKYVRQHMRDGVLKKIEMDESIFGSYFIEEIGKEEMSEIFHHGILGASVVTIYVRYLCDKLICPNGLRNRFAFISPHETAFLVTSQARDIAKVLLNNTENDKLIIATYNIEKHWVLIAINVTSETIYYMDAMHGDYNDYEQMKDEFDLAIQSCRSERGAIVAKSKSSNITWVKISCPRQTNLTDCGYYVLRFMKEIISLNQIRIPANYFSNYRCQSYSKDKLTEIKEE